MTKRIIFVVFIVGVATSALIRPPYLQNVTQNSIDVMWGSTDTTGTLYWGNSPGTSSNSVSSTYFTDNAGDQVHTASITGLIPDETVYYYIVIGIDSIGWNDSSYYATSAPAGDTSFRFITYGDSRPRFGGDPDLEPHARVLATMIPHNPDVVLHTGDIARQGYLWEFNNFFFIPAAELAKNTPIFTTLGNHELPYGTVRIYEDDVRNYRDIFDLPSNNSEGIEDYYSFDYGSVHFISLNTEWVKPGNGYYDGDRATAMKNWLESDLASTSKPWKVVFFHKQSYLDYVEDEGWRTIFEQYGVNIVFHGHAHNYLAHYRNNVAYITTGGGGSPVYPIDWWGWREYIIKGFSDNHFIQVDVSDSRLNINAFDDNNVLRHWIDMDPSGNATYPPTEAVDDFEEYSDDIGLQGGWQWVGVVDGVQMDATQIYLDTNSLTGSKVMRVESSFTEDSRDGYGYAGLPAFWDWSNYVAIKLWAKSSFTGYSNQYFQIRLHEGSGGEKWKSPQISLSSITPDGEYVYLYFDDFTKYGDGGGSLINNELDLNAVVNFFVIPGFNGWATDNGTSTILIDNITAVVEPLNTAAESALPGKFMLQQNYPNPFNPVTTIRYDLPTACNVQLVIYDILGREVVKLVDRRMKAGYHSSLWQGTDRFGRKVASGVYFYQLKAGNFTAKDKLLLIR